MTSEGLPPHGIDGSHTEVLPKMREIIVWSPTWCDFNFRYDTLIEGKLFCYFGPLWTGSVSEGRAYYRPRALAEFRKIEKELKNGIPDAT